MRKIIENRLIDFSVSIINLCENMKNRFVSQHLANQLIRSSTSAALNYGEAQGAESRKDFIHKTSIVLKELRESQICLYIIKRAQLIKTNVSIDNLIAECSELVAIFQKTVVNSRKKQ